MPDTPERAERIDQKLGPSLPERPQVIDTRERSHGAKTQGYLRIAAYLSSLLNTD